MKLGPFELHASIARGGMGEVWRGLHVTQQLPVAVKVVTSELARDLTYRSAFRDEVRAMARLDHSGIVTVLDHGEVDDGDEIGLASGSPYLVMEWVGGGSLANVDRLTSWSSLKTILIHLLDALAHAHARGVIHRDIKASNVLVRNTELGHELKLTDFGIAHAAEHVGLVSRETTRSGTPRYMAPEQIQGTWRDQGPWTDLYAVGCLAYRLATGKPPFWRGELEEILRSHLVAPPPPLETAFPVPRELPLWLSRMLAKHPARRYHRAADAVYALTQIDDSDLPPAAGVELAESFGDGATLVLGTLPQQDTAELSATLPVASWGSLTSPTENTPFTPLAVEEDVGPTIQPAAPPFPSDWRPSTKAARKSMDLVGAGLGLYGLRPIPLVDRDDERDLLWSRLEEVTDQQSARVVVMRGAAGNGKSRLAEWLGERAHEVGAATVLHARHSPVQGSLDSVARMLASYLRVTDLPLEESKARIRTHLQRYDAVNAEYHASALATLAAGLNETPGFRFTGPTERYIVLNRFVQRLSAVRPVLIVLDDVQWGPQTLQFARFLLRRQSRKRFPVLLVMTVVDERLSPAVERQLELIDENEAATTLHVERLGENDHAHLVGQLLRLDGELADQVNARTNGNPLFAVQLVGDWVQRGVLEVGHDGFRLRPGETATIPNDIHELWTSHVNRIVSRFPGTHAREVLEIAAVLGMEIDAAEWAGACAEADMHIPAELVATLLGSRLAEGTESGWSFAHGMLRESLERASQDAGRLAGHHDACARMLSDRTSAPSILCERLALHLLGAGRLEDALEPLLDAAQHHTTTSEFERAHELYELRDAALRELSVARDDERWTKGWTRQARTFAKQGQLEDCERAVQHAEEMAIARDWPERIADCAWLRGHLCNKRGDVEQGIAQFQQGLELYEELGNTHGVGNCLYGLGELRKMKGDHENAIEAYERAVKLLAQVGDTDTQGIALAGLSDTHRREGRMKKALELSTEALALLRAVGNRNNIAVTLNDRGDICRNLGDLEQAESLYREAVQMLSTQGSSDVAIVRLNLSLCLLERNEIDEAHDLLERAEEELRSQNRAGYLAFVHALQLQALAGSGEWDVWDQRYEQLTQDLEQFKIVDEDLARPLHRAGEICADARHSDRARDVLQIALEQWQALQKEDEAARVRDRLERI